MTIERRSLQQQVQPDGGALVVTLPFNSRSQDLGGFVEVIHPAAFKRSLEGNEDILALWSHDTSKPLARRSNGSLKITADGAALTATIKPDSTSWSTDAAASIASGTTRGGSFGFITRSDSWERRGGAWLRTLTDVDLLEISPVALPAYPGSAAAAATGWDDQ